MPAYVYIVTCSDNTFYTGWTTQLEKRIDAHNAGTGAKYTKPRRPVRLVYHERYRTRSAAMKQEAWLKRLSRAQKEGLIGSALERDKNVRVPER